MKGMVVRFFLFWVAGIYVTGALSTLNRTPDPHKETSEVEVDGDKR